MWISLFQALRRFFLSGQKEYEKACTASPDGDLINAMDFDILHKLADRLLEYGPSVVAIKCGSRGFYLKTGGREAFQRMGRAMPDALGTGWKGNCFRRSFTLTELFRQTVPGMSVLQGFLPRCFQALVRSRR
jgi:hypothetical protein